MPVAVLADTPKPQSKFTALRVIDAEPEMPVPSQRCTVVWSAEMRLEMPAPAKLAVVGSLMSCQSSGALMHLGPTVQHLSGSNFLIG